MLVSEGGYPFWVDKTMQVYGNFQVFLLIVPRLGLYIIQWPPYLPQSGRVKMFVLRRGCTSSDDTFARLGSQERHQAKSDAQQANYGWVVWEKRIATGYGSILTSVWRRIYHRLIPPAFPGLCGSTATSATSVPTRAAPPAAVADMHWQPYHFIAPAPEEETQLPTAWPEAPPKAAAAAAAAATGATTAPYYSPSARSGKSILPAAPPKATAATTNKSNNSNSSNNSDGVVLVVVVLVLVIVFEVEVRHIDIISSSLGHQSKSAIQTSNPSPSPTSLDMPAKPGDLQLDSGNS